MPTRLKVLSSASATINTHDIKGSMFFSMADAGAVQFTIQCKNVPIGAMISFASTETGPQPPIYLAPTVVSTFPAFTTGLACDVPAGYAATISYTLQLRPEMSHQDMQVTLQAAIPVSV